MIGLLSTRSTVTESVRISVMRAVSMSCLQCIDRLCRSSVRRHGRPAPRSAGAECHVRVGHQLDEHALCMPRSPAALLGPRRALTALNERFGLSAAPVGERESSHSVALFEVGDGGADVVEASVRHGWSLQFLSCRAGPGGTVAGPLSRPAPVERSRPGLLDVFSTRRRPPPQPLGPRRRRTGRAVDADPAPPNPPGQALMPGTFNGNTSRQTPAAMRRAPMTEQVAEVAVWVDDAWERRGVGGLLLREILASLMQQGYAEAVGFIEPSNIAARRLIERVSPNATRELDDDIIEVRMPLSTVQRGDRRLSRSSWNFGGGPDEVRLR